MELLYKSTRNDHIKLTASQAILKGLSDDGGLFVPEYIPRMELHPSELVNKSYQEIAYQVLKLFLTDFTEEELRDCIRRAYDGKFDTPEIAPVAKVGNTYFLELFHGPTIAFKDMALSILPHLMTTAARKNGVDHEIVILTATSGDTGKAALAGFAGVPGTRIAVFYPKDGVSPIQEKQMVTQKGDNTFVAGIHGNFDDAQTGVKEVFGDREMAKEMDRAGFQFSSANSINIGRLVPQIAYYVYAYVKLLENEELLPEEELNVTVPTGNFGNILAAYYAREMGLPIGKLVCASNENKVLYDFFETGTYDRNREFVLTSSPSMDILISSNLERLVYKIAGEDAGRCRDFMGQLAEGGSYTVTPQMREQLAIFAGKFATEEETAAKIRQVYEDTGYVLDTHTAVAAAAADKYRAERKDKRKMLVASTASPFKFTRSVMEAIGAGTEGKDDFALADELSQMSGLSIPRAVEEIRTAPVVHKTTCEPGEMKQAIRKFLGIR